MMCLGISVLLSQTPKKEKTYTGKKAQKKLKEIGITSDTFLDMAVTNACKCSDTIQITNKSSTEIGEEISKCVDDQVLMYMMVKSTTESNNKDITLNVNPDSDQYKSAYFEIEEALMINCETARYLMANNNKKSDKSVSKHELAVAYFDKALIFDNKGELEKARELYELSVNEDPEFAFAWDNLGLVYRKLGNYDKAIECYKQSLKVDPTGETPAQNLAIAYEFKKEYDKAIEYYTKLDENNPERFYGIGRNYALKGDLENALDNMCKAYVLYDNMKSPYRADAQNLINAIRQEMIKNGQKKKFDETLKKNNITAL